MFLRILKRDLKRKKTMNLILLIFVFLASAFISASVGNILSITGALDHFFEVSQVPDSILVTLGDEDCRNMDEFLPQVDAVDGFEKESVYAMTQSNFSCEIKVGTILVHSFEDAALCYHGSNNQKLKSVEQGVFYTGDPQLLKLKVGQTLQINNGDTSVQLTYGGTYKDPVMSNRLLVSQADFDALHGGTQSTVAVYYITTEDVSAVEQALDQRNMEYTDYVSNEELRMSFVLHMVLAGTLLIVSAFLMLISFVVLRFVIGFSIAEEFRQIGVMKAIGLSDLSIRSLYTAKYFAIALLGSVLGFLASVPLEKALLDTVSAFIVMPTQGFHPIAIVCSASVLLLTVLFSFLATKKVKKLTPLDAIRSGSVGERFRKRSFLHLHKSHAKPSVFIAANDMISSPKRFIALILVFALCLSLVLILVNATNTLRSDKLLDAFNWNYSHLFVSEEKRLLRMMQEDGKEYSKTMLHELEEELRKEGLEARCFTEVSFSTTLQYGENTNKTPVFQGVGTRAEEYTYEIGSAPRHAGEIALAAETASALGANIGDTITIPSFERSFMVTAIYHSMWNMGQGARVHESLDFSYSLLSSTFSLQVLFADDPDEEAVKDRIAVVSQIFGVEPKDIMTAGEYIDTMVGVADSLEDIQRLVLSLALVIIVLITVLMEHSFLTKERNEIALLKSLGFRNRSLIVWHTLRFAFTSILAAALSLALLMPLTKLSVGPVFTMMGAEFGIQYEIIASEVYVFYPLIFLLITIGSAALTALQIRKVKTNECTCVE